MENKNANDWAIDLLSEILICSKDTLVGLKNIRYPWREVMSGVVLLGDLSVSMLIDAAFLCGINHLTGAINSRREELEQKQMAGNATEAEVTEAAALSSLCPDNDIACEGDAYAIDGLLFLEHEDLYRRYLPDAIREFEEGVGCELSS